MPLKITINEQAVKARILFVTRERVNNVFVSIRPEIELLTKEIISDSLYNSPEAESLLSDRYGSLKSQFGLTENIANNGLREIVELAVSQISVLLIESPRTQLVFSLVINLGPINYDKIKSMDFSKYISERSGSEINWMDWLLTKGTQIVVYNWHMIPGDGRSSAIMVPKGIFRVKDFSGTVDDNMITRAIAKSQEAISLVLRGKINSAL